MKTRLREMLPADVPKVLELAAEQNARDGTAYSVPIVFDKVGKRLPNIVLALVAVTEADEVVQGHVFERTVEQTTFGIDREATVCSMHEQDAVFYLLRQRGFHDLHLLVPPERVAQMGHGLERIYGMSATRLTHFYRMLDPEQNRLVQEFYRSREAVNV